MKLSKSFHKWLKLKENSYLDDNKAEYIIDIREDAEDHNIPFCRTKNAEI